MFRDNIVGIATHGARIGYRGPLRQIRSPNDASALRIPNEISDNITQELKLGQITTLPQSYILSPLGAVQKKHNGQFAGWRLIHDFSYPPNDSVNDGIPPESGSLSYQTLDDAIALIAKTRQIHSAAEARSKRYLPKNPS